MRTLERMHLVPECLELCPPWRSGHSGCGWGRGWRALKRLALWTRSRSQRNKHVAHGTQRSTGSVAGAAEAEQQRQQRQKRKRSRGRGSRGSAEHRSEEARLLAEHGGVADDDAAEASARERHVEAARVREEADALHATDLHNRTFGTARRDAATASLANTFRMNGGL